MPFDKLRVNGERILIFIIIVTAGAGYLTKDVLMEKSCGCW
jgi:hypothetical protein